MSTRLPRVKRSLWPALLLASERLSVHSPLSGNACCSEKAPWRSVRTASYPRPSSVTAEGGIPTGKFGPQPECAFP